MAARAIYTVYGICRAIYGNLYVAGRNEGCGVD